MSKPLLEAHICVLRRFKLIRVYLYLLGLFVGISVKICEKESSTRANVVSAFTLVLLFS